MILALLFLLLKSLSLEAMVNDNGDLYWNGEFLGGGGGSIDSVAYADEAGYADAVVPDLTLGTAGDTSGSLIIASQYGGTTTLRTYNDYDEGNDGSPTIYLPDSSGTLATQEWANDRISSIDGVSQWITSDGNIYYSDGNVGIGTTGPTAKLDIKPDSSSSDIGLKITQTLTSGDSHTWQSLFELDNKDGVDYMSFQARGSDGAVRLFSSGGWSTVPFADNIGYRFLKSDNSATGIQAKNIVLASGDYLDDTSTLNPDTIYGSNLPSNNLILESTTDSTKGYILLSPNGGNVGIGNSNPNYRLQVGNNTISGVVARFTNSTGSCDINPTTSSVGCSSDIRLKKNITTLDGQDFILNTEIKNTKIDEATLEETNKTVLEKLISLNPVKYNWNAEDYQVDENGNDNKHIGFIAQEMEQVFPDLVATDKDTGMKSIFYTNLIPYTVEAIKEMNLNVKDLSSLDTKSATSLGSMIKNFLGDATNGIELAIFGEVKTNKITTKEICISDTECLSQEDLQILPALIQEYKDKHTTTDATISEVCEDSSSSNYLGALPCTYPTQLCEDSSASNYNGLLPCQYPSQTCTYGQIGTYPDCKDPDPEVCPDGQVGTYPDCIDPALEVCPEGQVGTYPDCTIPPVDN